MKNLLRILPTNPSKWLYWLFRRHYTLLLLDELLDSQYPRIQMVFSGGVSMQHVVGYSATNIFILKDGNLMTFVSRKLMRPFTYLEYYKHKDGVHEWLHSNDGQKILSGIVQLCNAHSSDRYYVKLTGRNAVELKGRVLNDFGVFKVLWGAQKHLYMLLFWDINRCHAFLPHQMVIRPLSLTKSN